MEKQFQPASDWNLAKMVFFKELITYVLKETAALEGYEKTEEEWEIVFSYQNDKNTSH